MPIADLALAALAAFAAARIVGRSGRHAAATAGVLLALVAADLLVFPLRASADDPGNRAYAVLMEAREGRVLELPMFEPGIHYGSVYDYYQLQAPRQRPGGYSTLVPSPPFDFYFLRNRLSCGVWLPGDEETLEELGIEFVTFHTGMYVQGKVPGAWFGWNGLLEHGFSPAARGGRVTLFTREAGGELGAPAPEPDRNRPFFCEGWTGDFMDERQAPFWVYGAGTLRLTVSASRERPATLWADAARADTALVSDTATLTAELEGDRWHAVVLEIPVLVDLAPPRGLRLDGLSLVAR